MGAFGCGNLLAWPAPALEKMCNTDETECDIRLTDEEASWVASIAYVGCVVVGPFAGKIFRITDRQTCSKVF